jgi:spectrin alpha
LIDRYTSLVDPMVARKQRLRESLAVQQLFRDVEDEEAWIREKEPIVASTNRGRDLIGVQNLIKKHQVILQFILGVDDFKN